MGSLRNIYRLGVKELWSLWRDPTMLILIVFSFTLQIISMGNAIPEALSNVQIAIVDEDQSVLSRQIIAALQPPHFIEPAFISLNEVDAGLDAGKYTFSLDIPPNFQRNVLSGKTPAIQLNVDATRMTQAFSGSGYIQQIVLEEINEFVQGYRSAASSPAELNIRVRFNPNLIESWFASVMQIINNITMLSIILTGAALIREREHGTIEHLLVMPVTPLEIMLSKIWAMGLVVVLATAFSLTVVIQMILKVPIDGSILLFLGTTVLHLFATTSMGIFLATLARTMPQFGMLMILTLLPMQMLSGGMTPRESMPKIAQDLMEVAPTTHFVAAAQDILYRGAGIEVVWLQMLALLVIGAIFFLTALARFRKSLSQIS